MTTQPTNHAAQRRVAMAVALAVWGACIWHVWTKSIFMDDAFIYLQVAKNILLEGTARFFPISPCTGLLASSPLKLLILVPSLALGWLLAPLPSLEAARWAFLASGLLTSLLFLPLCRPLKYWYWGLALAGLFFLTTESGMQMEGLLLFWCCWCFLVRRFPEALGQEIAFGPADVWILCLLALTRIEYALLPALIYACLLVYRMLRGKEVLFLLLPPLILGLGWVILALVLGVWPIPTTYLSKVLTGELKLFSENFVQLLPHFIDNYFLHGGWVWASSAGAVALALVALRPGHLRNIRIGGGLLVLTTLVFTLLLLERAPGSFLWYYENLFIAFLTLVAAVALGTWPTEGVTGWIWRAGAMTLLAGFVCINAFREYEGFDWNFDDPDSRAYAYMAVAAHLQGPGIYQFPDLPPMRLRMMEIGIASYFAGPDAWLYDLGGLAQIENLEGADANLLTRFYPRDALCSGQAIRQVLDSEIGASPPLRTAWHIPEDEAWKVHDYLREFRLGFNE